MLFQPVPNFDTLEPTIFIDDTELKNVDHYKYLGSVISSDGFLGKEIIVRISKASQALVRLCHGVLNNHNITLSTKLKVYNAIVLTSLLYDCKAWTLYQ